MTRVGVGNLGADFNYVSLVYKQRRDILISTVSKEINLIIENLKELLTVREVYYKSILYFEKQILFITELEMKERK